MSAHIAAAEARRPRPSSAARRAAVGALALLLGAIAPPVPGVAAPGDSPAVAEVGRLPVLASGTVRDWSGWLILSPKSRRLYQVLENPLTTEIQSFDLDTLARRRRATFRGSPVLGGLGNGTGASGTTQFVGEALHAVDEERGLLYLPMMDPLDAVALAGLAVAGVPNGSPDGARPLTRMVVIDEKRFDAGAADFSASFVPPPATATVARTHWLQGMETVADPRGGPARLVLAFAQPGLRQTPAPNHTVTAWDVDTPAWSATPDPVVFPPADTPTGWETPPPLAAQCGRATMTDTSFPTHGAYSWGLLPTAKALYLVC
ncbi:MAG: hypothetical protein KY443_06735, partial [Actinobacteria bacterium]|nr:hypothetical protein [Actinomycetota bacterium]